MTWGLGTIAGPQIMSLVVSDTEIMLVGAAPFLVQCSINLGHIGGFSTMFSSPLEY